MSSDRVALGCIAALLAVPLVSGGAAAWALFRYRQAHPPLIAEPPPPESTAPSVAAAPVSAPVPTAPSAPLVKALPPSPAPSIVVAAPPPVETTNHVVFDAKVTGIDPKGAALAGLAPGTRCTLETTLAAVDRNDLHVAGNLLARCGPRLIGQSEGVPGADLVKVIEQPGIAAGTYTYSLTFADANVSIDTPHGSATVVIEGDADRTVSLVIANESRPLSTPLLRATSETRVFHAGAVTNDDDDDLVLGQVVSATGDVPLDAGARCGLGFHHYGTIDGVEKCDVLIVCGGVSVIGRPERFSADCKRRGSRVISAEEPKPGSMDNDPALDLNEQKARIWNDLDRQRWSITVALNPRR